MNSLYIKLYDIFTECFPYIFLSESVFIKKISDSAVKIFTSLENEQIIAFAVVEKNSLQLMCVKPEYQFNGHGKKLLKECEKYIADSGYKKVVLGQNGRFFYGAVMDSFSHRFFEKCGYMAFNGCLSMIAYLEETDTAVLMEKYPGGEDIFLSGCTEEDREELKAIVMKIEPAWINHCSSAVMELCVAARYHDGTMCGFVINKIPADTIATDDGCMTGQMCYAGVIPEQRNKRTGSALIVWSMDFLKKKGCTEAFMEYTSHDKWYSMLGFEEYLWYWLGEKELL